MWQIEGERKGIAKPDGKACQLLRSVRHHPIPTYRWRALGHLKIAMIETFRPVEIDLREMVFGPNNYPGRDACGRTEYLSTSGARRRIRIESPKL
jgi:hypothetical protein